MPSFFGLPFSMPILAMKMMSSKSLRSAVRRARAWSLRSSGLMLARRLEDAAQDAAADFRRLGVPGGRACEHEVAPELAPRVGAVDDDELAVQHLAVAVLGALEHAVLAGTAGADAHLHAGDRAGRDELDIARRRGSSCSRKASLPPLFQAALLPGCSLTGMSLAISLPRSGGSSCSSRPLRSFAG